MSASTDDPPGGPVPAVARCASTVIVLRDGERGGVETFMVRRDPESRFAAGAFVFPGGAVSDDDFLSGGRPPCTGLTAAEAHRRLHERGSEPPADPALGLALYLAAVRELYEEAGILLARSLDGPADGALAAATCERLAELRPVVQRGARTLAAVAEELRLDLLPESLVYFSHWITPLASPRRFDTRFFVVEDLPGQAASHCGIETVDGRWFAPADALRLAEAGEITLVSVTVEHLRVLTRFDRVGVALAFARQKPIRTVLARRDRDGWDLGGDGPW